MLNVSRHHNLLLGANGPSGCCIAGVRGITTECSACINQASSPGVVPSSDLICWLPSSWTDNGDGYNAWNRAVVKNMEGIGRACMAMGSVELDLSGQRAIARPGDSRIPQKTEACLSATTRRLHGATRQRARLSNGGSVSEDGIYEKVYQPD